MKLTKNFSFEEMYRSDTAQRCGIDIGRQRLFDWLRENGYIFKQSREPMQKWIERGIMTVRECWVTTDHGMELAVTPMITGKGQEYFLNLFCGEK